MVITMGITPNEQYLLWCIYNKIKPVGINVHSEFRKLKSNYLITDSKKITEKGLQVIEAMENIVSINAKDIPKKPGDLAPDDKIDKYLELFPKGKLPSGKMARADKKNIKSNFTWFFKNYKYDWDTVLKATALYVDEYEAKNYMYMKTSQYFISKMNPDKSRDSELANYCYSIVNNDYEDRKNPFSEKVV